MTRVELEETAYDNKNRWLEAWWFVDYYDALSIYATTGIDQDHVPADRDWPVEEISAENPNRWRGSPIPCSGSFLMKAFGRLQTPQNQIGLLRN